MCESLGITFFYQEDTGVPICTLIVCFHQYNYNTFWTVTKSRESRFLHKFLLQTSNNWVPFHHFFTFSPVSFVRTSSTATWLVLFQQLLALHHSPGFDVHPERWFSCSTLVLRQFNRGQFRKRMNAKGFPGSLKAFSAFLKSNPALNQQQFQ